MNRICSLYKALENKYFIFLDQSFSECNYCNIIQKVKIILLLVGEVMLDTKHNILKDVKCIFVIYSFSSLLTLCGRRRRRKRQRRRSVVEGIHLVPQIAPHAEDPPPLPPREVLRHLADQTAEALPTVGRRQVRRALRQPVYRRERLREVRDLARREPPLRVVRRPVGYGVHEGAD